MKDSIEIQAPAKINIHLDVGNKRSDGYHEIVSIFQAVSLFDTIFIEIADGIGTEIIGSFDCPLQENTMYKAVTEFQKLTLIKKRVVISVKKNIPVKAGLGGGSSDCAAVLQGLNTIFDTKLSNNELAYLGSKIGSDVPFFCMGTCGIVTGRGEKIALMTGRTPYFLVIVWPDVAISTKLAFQEIDDARINDNNAFRFNLSNDELKSMYLNQVVSWKFGNTFQEVLKDKYTEIAEVLSELTKYGAIFSQLSGSGSAVFGVFEDEKSSKKCFDNIFRRWPVSFTSIPLASGYPLILQ